MRKFLSLLPLFFLLAISAFGQTAVGGFVAPVPWPNVPMSGNEIVNGGMENCTLGPCGVGNLTLSNWTLGTGTCTTFQADNSVAHTGTFSMNTTNCGSTHANAVIQQNFTYQGLGSMLQSCWYNDTLGFNGVMDGPMKYVASGVDVSTQLGRISYVGNGGLASTLPGTSAGFFPICRETFVNRFTYQGAAFTFQMRYPIPGELGQNNIDDVSLVEEDYPIRTFLTSDMDGAKGYLFADIVSQYCLIPGTSTVCGNTEIMIPAGAASMTVTVQAGSNPTCTTSTFNIINAVTYSADQVVPWQFPLSAISASLQSTPTTPYYICESALNNTTSQVYAYPAYKFYPLNSSFRNSLTNYIGSYSEISMNGSYQMPWGLYDSCTATNCQGGSGGGPFSITISGSASAAINAYLTQWAGMGFAQPISTSTATHSGQQIKKGGPERMVDLQSMHFNFYLNFVDLPSFNALSGPSDQLAPFWQLAFNYGLHIVELNNFGGTGWDGNYQITAATVPPSPTAPTLLSTGGFILSSQFPGTQYVWTEVCPAYWSFLGQQGNTPTPGTCSAPVPSSNFIPFTSTVSISQPMPSCSTNNFRQIGWYVADTVSPSNSLASPPSDDTFFIAQDASNQNNSGLIACSQSGGPTTQVFVGNPGSGNSLGQTPLMAPMNDYTLPPQPSNAPAAPTVVVNGTAGVKSYTYACTSLYGVNETQEGPTTKVTTGNATLSGGNFNAITCPSIPSATSENVYRTASTGSPATVGLIGNVSVGGTLNDTGLTASGSAPTTNVVIEVQAVGPGFLTQPSQSLQAVGGTTITFSGCITGANGQTSTGWYLDESSVNQNNPQPWTFYMQENPGSPALCSASIGIPTPAAMSTQYPAPDDFTNTTRPTWATTVSDPNTIGAYLAISNGVEAANYPTAQNGILAVYCCDEANPASANYNGFDLNLGPYGYTQGNPGILVFGVSTSGADYKMWRDAIDIATQDPYFSGRSALSDIYVTGGWCRNGLIYSSTNNVGPSLTFGCTPGSQIMLPQQSDVAAFSCMLGNYGSRPCPLVLQLFGAVAFQKGFDYGDLRRTCWKGIIDEKSFNDNGFGCIWWTWGNGEGMDEFWYTYGTTNTYRDFKKLSDQTMDAQLQRTLLSPTIDSSGPQLPGFHTPSIGTYIRAVRFSQTLQNACSPTTLLPNSYANTSYFPYAPLAFFSAQDSVTGDVLFGFNNLCGALNTNATGGVANQAAVLLGNIPPGQTIVEWWGGDLNGNSSVTIGSSTNCPALAPLAAGEICIVLNDQEANFGWLRVPRQVNTNGDVVEAGKVVTQ